ncbi:MAG: Helix-turn-helix domain [Patescibacteria group bacterium]|nr:Helix-turn-helix domain [Patescibacteria group bacterium]
MKTTKKNINDPILEARKDPNFEKYSEAARIRGKIGIEVFSKRKEKNMSQQELAKAVGTTQRVISSIENGDTNPGTVLLVRIGKELGFNSYNLTKIYECREVISVINSQTFSTHIDIKNYV